ncbi:MAG: PQQ-binding-like beta-propeller repeat protein [Candidatus Cybelea sp.]
MISHPRTSAWALSPALFIALTGCGGIGKASPSYSPPPGAAATTRPMASPASLERRRVRKGSSETTDWDSFGFDLQRTGYNPVESTVGASNVGTVQKLWSANVGYSMVHEPVLAYGVSVNSQSTNVLYAGSANGSAMYAINAITGAVLWTDPVLHSSYRCMGQKLEFSIGETPAIDRGKNLLYFSDGHNKVYAVDLGTGKTASGWPLTIADYLHDHNFMHGGLTYNPANGMLYAVTGSTCDISPWYGRIVAIATSGPSVAGTFYTLTGTSEQGASGGGIWGPGGASIDPSTNNVFVATGNADTSTGATQNAGYAEQIVELSSTLGTIIASNYPPNIPVDGDSDFDFGATPLLFQPYGCPEMLAAVNKSGMFELYDVSSISSGPIQYIAMSIPTNKGDFVGVPAFDPVTGYVYVGLPASEGIYHPGLAAFSIQSNCTLNPTPVWNAKFGPDGKHLPGSQTPRSPISIANGVVYISNYSLKTEFAFDAATGTQLWSVGLSDWGDVGTIVADGVVYVSARDGTITAWAPAGSKARKRNSQTR